MLEGRPDTAHLERKQLGAPGLKWLDEVRIEAEQSASMVKDKLPLEDLWQDKNAWAAALRDHVKVSCKMIGELK